EILLGREPGHMRAIKADRQEERPILVLLEKLDRLGGADAVGLFVITTGGGMEGKRGTEAILGRQVLEKVLLLAVAANGVDDLVPRLVVVQAAGADLGGHAVVVDLADAGDEVAKVTEELGEGDDVRHILAEVRGIL